jgi:hypothetical protein
MAVLSVMVIESHTVSEGKVGAITRKLTEAYEGLLKKIKGDKNETREDGPTFGKSIGVEV